MESDCLEVVNLINNQEYYFAAEGIIVGEIQDLLFQLNIFEIYFRPRECNAVAHTIATFIVQSGWLFFLLEEEPSWLMNCIKQDMPVIFNYQGSGTTSPAVFFF